MAPKEAAEGGSRLTRQIQHLNSSTVVGMSSQDGCEGSVFMRGYLGMSPATFQLVRYIFDRSIDPLKGQGVPQLRHERRLALQTA